MARKTDHKESCATVKVICRIDKILTDGTYPFWIRITKDRKSKYVATGLAIHPKFWDESKQDIRRSYPDYLKRELRERLKKLVERYETSANALADADEQHDVKDIASKAIEGRKQTRRTTLLTYVDTIVEGMVNARQTGNSIVYRDLRNQLAKFITDEYNASDIPFDKVTVSFCYEWENTLRSTGASDNTLSNRFRTLRAVLNRAIANGYAKPDSYPFARNVAEKHKFSIGKFDTTTRKRVIRRDDVRKIEAFTPIGAFTGKSANLRNAVEVEQLTLAKNVFLFSFYVGGINFVDLAKIRWRDISTDGEGSQRLTYVRQKTGGKFSIKLLPIAAAIIEQYRPFTHNSPDSYVFPILNANQHQTPTQIHNRTHKVSAMVNADLKTLGERVGIATPLTTYVARHSFATSLRQSGVSTAVISQAMGHADERTTQIYLESFGSETVDSAYDALL